jgi:antirestriction protein ArdC
LILAQRPDATRVAGFRSWQRMNRYVRRGETGIKILVPMARRVLHEAREEGGEDDAEADQRRVFFGVGHVFDVSQTEGESLPRVEVPVLQGDEGADLYGHLAGVAAAEGVSIEQVAQLRGEMMSYYEPPTGRIVLRQAPQRQMTKTLAHELGHHFSGTTESSPEEETLAESVAYVVCSRFGLDTGERSFPYIAIWSRQPRVFRAALTRIQAISSEIIGRIEPRGLELSGE